MKEKDINEETNLLNSQNVGDLLEPLVNEEKPKISSNKKFRESVNVISNNDTDINNSQKPLRFKTSNLMKVREKV